MLLKTNQHFTFRFFFFISFMLIDVCIQRPDQRHQTEERRDENILLNCGCLFHLHVTYNM